MTLPAPTQPGLSRFSDDLPDVDSHVCLGEGNTPLIPLRRLGDRMGIPNLAAKMETQNPTGSYKDRVAAMTMALAVQHGNRGWIGTSSGNAGLAMAAYGSRALVPGLVCIVASAPLEKRLPLMPYAAKIVGVDGVGTGGSGATGMQLMEMVKATAGAHDLCLAITAHAYNPDGMRGIDTLAYELHEQLPDATHVYVPTGGGGLLTAIARGLRHRNMRSRVVACQPTGCAPIADYVNGRIRAPVIDRCDSDISALQLPQPPDGDLAAKAVAESGGWGATATDEEILSAQRLLAEDEGIFVEPASAASLAAVVKDVRSGRLSAGDVPALILTGAGWKDLSRFSAKLDTISSGGLDQAGRAVQEWADGL